MGKIRDVSLVFLRRRTDGIDQVCLAMKKRGFGAGRFNGQGGKPEEGGAIDACARREVFEEVGVRVSGLDKVAEIEFRFSHNEKRDQLVHVFVSSDWVGEPVESDEMRPEWFAVDKLPFNEMWPADVRWLPSVLEDKKIIGKCVFGEEDSVREFAFHEVDGFNVSKLFMLEYLENNRRVYDALAEEFQAKTAGRDANTKRICDEFCSALSVSAAGRCVLELGAGPGMISRELGDRGYAVTALEFASKMAEVCRRNAPDAILIVDEFLAHDFGVKKFDGIVAIAFVHMFSSAEIGAVFAKIKTLLAPQGVVYLSTTIHDEPTEGYFSKVNFEQPLKRFRKRFTRLELEGILATEGFVIVYSSSHDDNEERGKTWMNYIVS